MQRSQQSIFNRHDTMFGVCEAIGQDFGFNPNYLRVIFGVTLLLSPAIVLGIYAGTGVIVAASRWLYPPRTVRVQPAAAKPLKAENDESWIELASAA